MWESNCEPRRSMKDFQELYSESDELMRSVDFAGAAERYSNAWNEYAEQRRTASAAGNVSDFDAEHTPLYAFWLLMSGANAQFCSGDFAGCHDTGVTAYELFRDIGLIAGNPFFHLRMGQASYELASPEDRNDESGQGIDNLARALICGGIEIFSGEDEKYRDAILPVLRPPEGYASWQDAKDQGCSLDKLNGTRGFLREFFTAKYGSPPPYAAPQD
jgi:hypothetical protein